MSRATVLVTEPSIVLEAATGAEVVTRHDLRLLEARMEQRVRKLEQDIELERREQEIRRLVRGTKIIQIVGFTVLAAAYTAVSLLLR